MTPFGQRMREMRRERGLSLKAMAAEIGVSSSYLSALEHGRRGRPTWLMTQRIISYFNVIWDEAEELQRLAATSHPRVVIDTAGLDPAAAELAAALSETIDRLPKEKLGEIARILREAAADDPLRAAPSARPGDR